MMWLKSRPLDEWLKIIATASAVMVAASLVYAVLVLGEGATWESAVGKFIIHGSVPKAPAQGEAGQPRLGSNLTVWESECPENSIPISGSCIALSPGVALQNIGPSGQKWECAWSGPMPKADVRAVCLMTK